ncbi:MAG: patatin-like phospholipase RssA [Alphaproteobacteria bacterium]|nr:patatin-like phospholipase RssA [Alphaproteobacteria bacterium]
MNQITPPIRPPAPHRRRKIGLALSSGMARGWAHIGAIRALNKLGFEFDVITGCSVGALAGGCYLAGRLDSLEEWAKSLNKRKILSYMDMRLRSGGLIGGGKLVDEMRKYMGNAKIEDFPIPFAAMTTDLVTGHEIWLQTGDLVEALRASFSLPGIFPPVKINNRWLADGAMVSPLPVAACRAMGADMVIAINLNADMIGKSRRKDSNIATAAGFDMMDMLKETGQEEKIGLMDSLTRRVFRRDYDGPSVFGVMTSSLNIMQDRITRSRLAGDPPDVHIAPRLGHFGLLEFDRAEEAIREGEAAVMRKQPELADAMQILSQTHNIVGENEPI